LFVIFVVVSKFVCLIFYPYFGIIINKKEGAFFTPSKMIIESF